MKTSKKERICAITGMLMDNPNVVYPLSHFAELFDAAKSTLSEDISVIKETLPKMDMGEIDVLFGANGGYMLGWFFCPLMYWLFGRASREI